MTDQPDSQKFAQAAHEFVRLAIEGVTDERGVHAETAVAAVARMAGTFLFRSFGFHLPDAKPGQPVLSEAANEQGPRLVEIAANLLVDAGIHVSPDNVTDESRQGHEPLLGFLETQGRLEPKFDEVRKTLGLSLPEAADAGAIATALLITQCAQVLDPNVAFDLAVYSFIEGSKTVPS